MEPADADLLVGAERGVSSFPGSMRASAIGAAQSVERLASHGPATTRDQSRSPSAAAPSAETSAPASIRIASAKVSPRSAAARSTWRN